MFSDSIFILQAVGDPVEHNQQVGRMECTSTRNDDDDRSDVSIIEVQNSVIKGYHAYKIRPPFTEPPTYLRVDREYSNIKDLNACLVWIPVLSHFKENVHSMITDAKRLLKLSDVADLPIGHVPRSLAGLFRSVLDGGGEIFAEATGEPIPSFAPWPAYNEEGGGVVIPATYFIHAKRNINVVAFQIKDLVSKVKECTDMTIVIK